MYLNIVIFIGTILKLFLFLIPNLSYQYSQNTPNNNYYILSYTHIYLIYLIYIYINK